MKVYQITVYEGPLRETFTLRAEDDASAIEAAKQRPQLIQTEQGASVWIQRGKTFIRLERNKKNQWVGGPFCQACKGKSKCK